MNRLKLLTITGTRPKIIRLTEVINKCDINFVQILVCIGCDYYLKTAIRSSKILLKGLSFFITIRTFPEISIRTSIEQPRFFEV